LSAVYFALQKNASSKRAIPAVLAFFWLWVGLAFWLPSVLQGYLPGIFFTALFVIQGGLFVVYFIKPGLEFGFKRDACAWSGVFCLLYALVGYPLAGALVGHTYPHMSPFGLTPCPVVTFTFGLLLLTTSKVPKILLIIPFFYAMSGFLWISIGMWEDIGMLLSGLLGAGLIWYRDARMPAEHQVEPKPASANGGWSLDIPDKKTTINEP
ncbi:MAG TPA: DUF6064 family protein, partial [Anaerolineales bacterium]|nr:DUF6064 family protein [Anaerolineales bacterium]